MIINISSPPEEDIIPNPKTACDMQQLELLIYHMIYHILFIRYHLESHVARHEIEAMKEILLAGDTNRLVAELTFVA